MASSSVVLWQAPVSCCGTLQCRVMASSSVVLWQAPVSCCGKLLCRVHLVRRDWSSSQATCEKATTDIKDDAEVIAMGEELQKLDM